MKRVEIRGMQGMIINFRKVSADTRKRVQKVTRLARNDTVKLARQLVPKDTRRMMRSITGDITSSGLTFVVYYDPQVFENEGQPYYPVYVEFGTSLQAAQPTLEPSFNEMKPIYLRDIKAAMRRATR